MEVDGCKLAEIVSIVHSYMMYTVAVRLKEIQTQRRRKNNIILWRGGCRSAHDRGLLNNKNFGSQTSVARVLRARRISYTHGYIIVLYYCTHNIMWKRRLQLLRTLITDAITVTYKRRTCVKPFYRYPTSRMYSNSLEYVHARAPLNNSDVVITLCNSSWP